ncbi:hypothetical protein BJ170DRAFT_736334 [Xylariales sp. AK1849]|nr:hypothetical protein BJ170DRAFT_736334 [Xylariales sp. AK1849]
MSFYHFMNYAQRILFIIIVSIMSHISLTNQSSEQSAVDRSVNEVSAAKGAERRDLTCNTTQLRAGSPSSASSSTLQERTIRCKDSTPRMTLSGTKLLAYFCEFHGVRSSLQPPSLGVCKLSGAVRRTVLATGYDDSVVLIH